MSRNQSVLIPMPCETSQALSPPGILAILGRCTGGLLKSRAVRTQGKGALQEQGLRVVEVNIVEDPRMAARTLIERGETDAGELWLLYFANGGNAMEWEFEAYLHGLMELSPLDLDLVAVAVRDVQDARNARRP